MLQMIAVKKRRKSVILRLLLLAFSVYILISLINYQVQLTNHRRDLAEKQSTLEAKNLEVSELERLLESGTESQLIERAARERLGYVYPDEQVYVDLSGQ